MEPEREFTSEQILSAHVAFLRLMVEAMAPNPLPPRGKRIDIAAEARTIRLALHDILTAAAPSTLAALSMALDRIGPARCGTDPGFARRVAARQRRILDRSGHGEFQVRQTNLKVEVFALWMLVTALITTSASEDRLLTARQTVANGLAALDGGEDDATHLSIRVQIDFYDTCLDAFTSGALTAFSLH